MTNRQYPSGQDGWATLPEGIRTGPASAKHYGSNGYWVESDAGWSVYVMASESVFYWFPTVMAHAITHEDAAVLNDIRIWAQCQLASHSMTAEALDSYRLGCSCGGSWSCKGVHGYHNKVPADARLHLSPDGRRCDVEVTT